MHSYMPAPFLNQDVLSSSRQVSYTTYRLGRSVVSPEEPPHEFFLQPFLARQTPDHCRRHLGEPGELTKQKVTAVRLVHVALCDSDYS